MVQTQHHSREEGTTTPLAPQKAEKIWHGPKLYSCTIESILTDCITTNCSASDRKALQRAVRTAQYIIGAKLPVIQDHYNKRRP